VQLLPELQSVRAAVQRRRMDSRTTAA